MAQTPNPNDPFVSPDDPYLTARSDEASRQARLSQARLEQERYDNELQPDPELAEGPASGGKVAMFAIAVAVILGAVFYGLNNSSVTQPGTATTAQNSAPSSPPAAPPGMRDVTPRANTAPGTTTGAAPANPQTPPSPSPTGQEINRTANPPATNDMPQSK